ncbi:hypothetical protein THAOC_03137 [Thalassiosira oceanica]|uniref:Uncharacterized protein n=1 Tax=Thalassiosira oceanica TaxID=159749 RepID=K0TCJ2_THAOC|nr:hypothetical protein THAOC_03137 [Thalassiosira oceanica]|eukprot:EJK75150.1 hypothetical protein THAOC_03137 [Thalassiosira oceanica]
MGVSSFGIVAAVAVLLSSPCPSDASDAARMVEKTWHPKHTPSAESTEAGETVRSPPALALDQRMRIGKSTDGKAGKAGKAKTGKSSSKVAKPQPNEWGSKSKVGKSGEQTTKSKIAKHQPKEWNSKSKVGKSGGPATKSGKPSSKSNSSKSQASATDNGIISSAAGESTSPAPTPKVSTHSPTNDSNARMNSSRPTIKTSDSPPTKAPEYREGGSTGDFETQSLGTSSSLAPSARPSPNPVNQEPLDPVEDGEITPVPSPAAETVTPKPILVDFRVENYPLIVTLRPTPPGAARSSPGRLEPTASVRSGGDAGGGPLGVPAIAGIVISALALVGAVILLLASRHEGRRLQDEPRQEATGGDDATTQPDLEAETDDIDEGDGGV